RSDVCSLGDSNRVPTARLPAHRSSFSKRCGHHGEIEHQGEKGFLWGVARFGANLELLMPDPYQSAGPRHRFTRLFSFSVLGAAWLFGCSSDPGEEVDPHSGTGGASGDGDGSTGESSSGSGGLTGNGGGLATGT